MSIVASELRELRRQNVRLHRMLVTQRMPGKVVQRDPAARKVRLELGVDPASGQPVLSPWVRVQSGSAGAYSVFNLPSIGEQMYLESPSGTVGADSLATFGAHDDDHPHPPQDADEAVMTHGASRRSMTAAGVSSSVGDASQSIDLTKIKSELGTTSHTVDADKIKSEKDGQFVTVNNKAVINYGKKVAHQGGAKAGSSQDEAMKNAIKAKAQSDLVSSGAQSVNVQSTLPSGASYNYTVSRP